MKRRYIDVNCFLGISQVSLFRYFKEPEELIYEIDDIGIYKTFVSHFNAEVDFINGNRDLMKMIEKYSDRLLPCWIANPKIFWTKGLCRKFISEAKSAGVRMIRVQPGPVVIRGFSLHRWAMDILAEEMIANNMVLLVDFVMEEKGVSGLPVTEYDWDILYQFASSFSQLPVIISGKKLSVSYFQVSGLLRNCKNVMLDISSFQTWLSTEIICKEVGAGHLVFGSQMPYFDAGQFLIQVEKTNITEEEKNKIASENITSIINI